MDAVDDDGDGDELHRGGGEIDAEAGEEAGSDAGFGGFADKSLPFFLHMPLDAHAFYGIERGDGLDDHAMLLRRLLRGFGDGAMHRPLQGGAAKKNEGDGDGWHNKQGPTNDINDGEENREKRQIDKRGDGDGGEKIAQRLEFAQMVGERASGGGARFHLQVQHLL